MSEEAARGDSIGPFRVVAPLEAGGMASLYLAHRPPDTNIVAIKVIQNQLREVSRIVRMFQDEVRTLTYIDHPNVVRVLEAGEYASGRYLVMEYVHGCSLARLIDELEHRDVALPASVAVHVGIEIALALHAAHVAVDDEGRPLNVVHRDVSPQNVMISESGQVKLIDFGIAQASGRLEVTNASLLKGKLRYMAPEQASGSPLDRRTDLFALGIVIWEMLTAKRFASSRAVDVFTRLLDPKATPPSDDNPEVSSELDAIVLSALSRFPDDRPDTGLDMAARLSASTDVSGGREGLRALVETMFSAELQYTRHWIEESFKTHDETTMEGSPVFPEALTKRVSREALFAAAAKGLAPAALELFDLESLPLELGLPVTKKLRLPSKVTPLEKVNEPDAESKAPRLDLTFTLLQARGPESTGAQPIVSLFEGPGPGSEPGIRAGFDESDATDQLAMRCLANLRHATWAHRPAGSPPSLSVIEALDVDQVVSAPIAPAQADEPSRWWLVFLALICLGAGVATALLLFR